MEGRFSTETVGLCWLNSILFVPRRGFFAVESQCQTFCAAAGFNKFIERSSDGAYSPPGEVAHEATGSQHW